MFPKQTMSLVCTMWLISGCVNDLIYHICKYAAVANLHFNLLNLLSGMTCGFLKIRMQVICKT